MNNPISSFSYFVNHTASELPGIPQKKIGVYQLTIALEGQLPYIVDDKEIILEKNDALLLVPGTVRGRLDYPGHTHLVIFNYVPSKGNEIQSNVLFKNSVNQTIRNLINSYPYNNYINSKELNITSQENEKSKLVLYNILNCIIIELFDTLKFKTQNQHVLSALSYINNNITEQLTLNSISEALHLSKEYTARIFKKEIGMTVSEFINQQKLNLAKNMLSNNALSLQDISNKLGYENYCYFSKLFKKQFGVSPLKIKKELSNY